jgi:ferredoxin
MRLSVDTDRCIASGACWLIAPALFEQGEDGAVRLVREDVGEGELELARAAAAACPAAVITIEDY